MKRQFSSGFARFLATVIVSCLPFVARALPVQDLYIAEVLVASRAQNELTEGARAGLLQVLVRVSGSTDVESNRLISAALRNPGEYYYQFGYETTDRSLMVGGNEVPASILRISFEPNAIARLLREAGFPVWGSNRPGVLVWLAYNRRAGQGTERAIVTEADTGPLMQSLSNRSKYRGLPLMYPLMDLEDAVRLSTAEVWGLFLDRVDGASVRYNPDVVVAGRAQREAGGQWVGRWFFRVESRWEEFDNVASSPDGLVTGIVDLVADKLAARYAVGSSQGSLILRVDGVRSLPDYAALSEYLESLTPVVESFVVEVAGDEIIYRLRTEGQSEQLMEIIGLDEKMLLINPGSGSTRLNPMHYRWVSNSP